MINAGLKMILGLKDEADTNIQWQRAKRALTLEEMIVGVGKGLGHRVIDEHINQMTRQLALQQEIAVRAWQLQHAKAYVAQEVWLLREEMLEDLIEQGAHR